MKSKNTKENLVHVRLERGEALESKRDLLSLELQLVQILKIIKEYKKLRKSELKIKKKIKTKTGSTTTKIKKIQTALPKIKLHPLSRNKRFVEKESEKDVHDLALESELKQIKEKLRALQA